MGFLDFLDPERGVKESARTLKQLAQVLEDDLIEQAMVKQGWWMSEEDGTLYPPGYTESSIITEGKLEVEPELGEERKWWQLW